MTLKLYDNDSYSTEFDAVVTDCLASDGKYRIELDRTLFFPEEGGQSCDRGSLDSNEVTYVEIKGDTIYHYCREPLQKGSTVHGKIDFGHRFRNMQNHSGEHIICGIAHSLFGLDNVGFHLGEDIVTMDLNGELTPQDIKTIEKKANEAVWKNMEVLAYYPSEDELAVTPYRSKGEISEDVRLVKIGDVDICACCAPHVGRTGEIGIIKIIDSMRHRGGMRLTIVCGSDAYTDYDQKCAQTLGVSNLLSVKQSECSDGVKKLLSDMAELRSELWAKTKELVLGEVAKVEHTKRAVCLFFEGATSDTLRLAANELKEKTDSFAVVLSGSDPEGYSFVMAIKDGDISDDVKKATASLDGRGGGKGSMASGRFLSPRKRITEFFENL